MNWLRRIVPWLLLAVVLTLLGLFAWMTTFPDSPTLAAAESWPWVGEPVARFRRVYARPPASARASSGALIGDGGPEIVYEAVPDIRYEDGPEALRQADGVTLTEWVWVEPGTTIRDRPADDGQAVGEISTYRRAQPLLSRPPWYRVRWEDDERGGGESVTGWVKIDRPAAGPGEPLLGNRPRPVVPLPSRPPEPVRLARARALLHPEATGRLGPYDFFTDVTDLALNGRLDRVARSVEDAYRRRFGITPVGQPLEAVVLFRGETAYRSFQGSEARLRDLPAGGHAGNGMAVLFVGDQPAETISAVLLHELTHLLNRRAVGPALPPWLDEGMAEDLGWSETDAAGRPVFGTWGGVESREGPTVFRTGGRAVVAKYRLSRTLKRLLPLDRLLVLDWSDFVRREEGLAYVQSGLFVRYLLESPHRAGFHRFLADTARGAPITVERLEETLGTDLATLDAELDGWVLGLPAG